MKGVLKYAYQIGQILLCILGIVALVLIISLSIRSLPSANASTYPIPKEVLPSQEILDTAVVNSPITKPPPETPIPVSNSSPFFNKAATFGTIIESGYSSYPSSYFIVNQWFADFSDRQITAFAGAIRNDPSLGGKALAKPWPSVLILEERDKDGNLLFNGGVEYKTPKNSGYLRIVDADKTSIFLVSNDNTPYIFDLSSHEFTIDEAKEQFSQQTNYGTIVEATNVPFPSEDFVFDNYWRFDLKDQRMYVFAGSERDDQSMGVIVKLVTSLDGKIIEGLVFPISNGPARIVDVIDEKVVIVTIGGLAIAFDVNSGNFYHVVNGKIGEPLSDGLSSSPTPYQQIPILDESITPTITPTITPLPTPNPYP